MKKIGLTTLARQRDAGTLSVRTGFHCPANGLWRPEDGDAEPVFIFEGSLMPASGGIGTVWHLVQEPQR
ncbi:hypothetical protein BIU82_18645 [Arthrobacter sp. SW1]|uniref:hypothetical protein n=1 Tax=Arthrobacter sp. SW1 TaxID=1920889 RepID=UPI000877BC81|nr:hypothetical protein [Arthrobacter sp. SW1]OFI38203.1 hypothetical protein BIU82_18735 [Arthrobacter sp. SW1]OFI38217.1 hypothetical protein BIU82_18645 [Arthrobacter sp. SW1]